MEDQIINEGGTPPTPEEAARIAAVDARRIADRDRKREQRRREKLERESSSGFQKRLRDESEAEATRRQTQERHDREALIACELTPPILPDEELDGAPGKSYWLDYFLPELEIFIDEVRRFTCGNWNHFYYEMAINAAGRALLTYYNVETPEVTWKYWPHSWDKFYLAYKAAPIGGAYGFANMAEDERAHIDSLKQVWDSARKAKP